MFFDFSLRKSGIFVGVAFSQGIRVTEPEACECCSLTNQRDAPRPRITTLSDLVLEVT